MNLTNKTRYELRHREFEFQGKTFKWNVTRSNGRRLSYSTREEADKVAEEKSKVFEIFEFKVVAVKG